MPHSLCYDGCNVFLIITFSKSLYSDWDGDVHIRTTLHLKLCSDGENVVIIATWFESLCVNGGNIIERTTLPIWLRNDANNVLIRIKLKSLLCNDNIE